MSGAAQDMSMGLQWKRKARQISLRNRSGTEHGLTVREGNHAHVGEREERHMDIQQTHYLMIDVYFSKTSKIT